MNPPLPFREAVQQLLANPVTAESMRQSYLSDSPIHAFEAFRCSEECKETHQLLSRYVRPGGRILEIGCGRGFAALALAQSGYEVTAVEPDLCDDFGLGATCALAASLEIKNIKIVRGEIAQLPTQKEEFDGIYTRQVLHHITDLKAAAQEVARVLKPRGVWIAAREHVVTDQAQLAEFLIGHPIHQLCRNEHAYQLDEYLRSLQTCFEVLENLGPYDSVINHYPLPTETVQSWLTSRLTKFCGVTCARVLASVPVLVRLYRRRLSDRCNTPGRMHSFVLRKRAGRKL